MHLPAEHAAGTPTPGRKLVPISDEEVEQRIHNLMDKERQNLSKQFTSALAHSASQGRSRTR